jgi:MFS family permease
MSWRSKSFELLPALSVRGKDLRATMRRVTVAWMFGVVWMSCIAGSQMTLFRKLLGFTNTDFGLMMGIAWAAYLGQLISATIIERTGVRKQQFLLYATIQRLLWLVIAALPLFLSPGRVAVWVFVSVYAAGAFLAHMAMPPWQNWMGDLIPRRIRGRYFAARKVWTTPVQILTVILAGLVLDWATVDQPAGTPTTVETQPYLLATISLLFAVGAIFGTIDVLLFARMREVASPPLARRSDRPAKRSLLTVAKAVAEPFVSVARAARDRDFIHYALYASAIAFAMTVAGPFFWLNALENIHYSKLGTNVVFLVCGPVSVLAASRLWGRLIDRWGRRPVLILCTAAAVFSPVGWFLIPPCAPEGMWLAYLIGGATCMLGGAMWTGIELARFNILLNLSQGAERSRYIGAAAVFTAVGGLIGGIFGGWLADHFIHMQYDHSPLQVGPFLWNNWHLTFVASMAARALALICLIHMPDPGARPFGEMMRTLRVSPYNNALPRLFWRLALWRRRRRQENGDSSKRPWVLRLLPRRGKRRDTAA